MRELAATWLPSTVEVGGETYRVPRPRARQAITVLSCTEAIAGGDESAWLEVKTVAREWLPPGLAFKITGGVVLSPEKGLKLMQDLLSWGLPERHEEDQEEAKEQARKLSWFTLLAEYAETYNTSPQEALETPWPLFIALLAEKDKLHARGGIRYAGWRAAAETGEIADLMERAGYGKHGDAHLSDEELEERQRESLNVLKKQYVMMSGGQATPRA